MFDLIIRGGQAVAPDRASPWEDRHAHNGESARCFSFKMQCLASGKMQILPVQVW